MSTRSRWPHIDPSVPGSMDRPTLRRPTESSILGPTPWEVSDVWSARPVEWAEGQARGATWITLDPRLSETAAASHTWIPLRPGTDGVFALALAHQILKNGWEDRAFLESATDVDRDTFWELLAPWTPEKAGALCQCSGRANSVDRRNVCHGGQTCCHPWKRRNGQKWRPGGCPGGTPPQLPGRQHR